MEEKKWELKNQTHLMMFINIWKTIIQQRKGEC